MFGEDGITNEVVEQRRVSSYFIPIAAPKKKGKKQLYFDTEWTKDRIEENKFINQIRERVSRWRAGGYVGVTKTTARASSNTGNAPTATGGFSSARLKLWKRRFISRRLPPNMAMLGLRTNCAG